MSGPTIVFPPLVSTTDSDVTKYCDDSFKNKSAITNNNNNDNKDINNRNDGSDNNDNPSNDTKMDCNKNYSNNKGKFQRLLVIFKITITMIIILIIMMIMTELTI